MAWPVGYSNQPVKFAAIELVPTTSSDVPETLLGHLNEDGTVTGGIPIPGLASWLSDPEHGQGDGRAGPGHGAARPTADHPADQHRPSLLGRHGGNGTLLFPGPVRGVMDLPAPDAGKSVVPPSGCRGWCSGGDHHGGRMDRDRGRPAAVDRL